MPVTSYKDLEVWKKSMVLVKLSYLSTVKFPRYEDYGLASQIRRASVSVAANIAEGWGRSSKGSFIQSLRIARGSLMELETEMLIAIDLSYIQKENEEELLAMITEISKMIYALIHKLELK